MPQPTRPQLALYAAFAIAVLLIGGRFLRSDDPGTAGGGSIGGASPGATTPASAGGSPAAGAAGGPSSGDAAADAALGGGAGTDAAMGGAGPGGADSDADAALGGGAGGAEAGSDADAALGGGAGAASLGGAGGAVVDVKGAVRRPGVYRVAIGARVLEAVERAGGLARRADRRGVNLAARVVDGGEVVVPRRGERAVATGVGVAGGGAGAPDGHTGQGSATGDAGAPLQLDINTASATELEQLDGVGPATAAKIVAYRDEHGPFSSVEELDAVSGIGEAKLAAIRTQLGR